MSRETNQAENVATVDFTKVHVRAVLAGVTFFLVGSFLSRWLVEFSWAMMSVRTGLPRAQLEQAATESLFLVSAGCGIGLLFAFLAGRLASEIGGASSTLEWVGFRAALCRREVVHAALAGLVIAIIEAVVMAFGPSIGNPGLSLLWLLALIVFTIFGGWRYRLIQREGEA